MKANDHKLRDRMRGTSTLTFA